MPTVVSMTGRSRLPFMTEPAFVDHRAATRIDFVEVRWRAQGELDPGFAVALDTLKFRCVKG